MKRFLSAVLTLVMIVSMFTTVSASIKTQTSYLPEVLEMDLGLIVEAKESGTETQYSTEGFVLQIGETEANKGVDYKATLDMGSIRELFDKAFIKEIVGNDAALKEEFENGKVATFVDVSITYPKSVIAKAELTSVNTGVLTAGAPYFEKSERTITTNVGANGENNILNIHYANDGDVFVKDLDDSENGKLKDITFELADAVAYAGAGEQKIVVNFTGTTKIEFESKTQTVNYEGTASHILTTSKTVVEHVLEVIPAEPATCSKAGHTEGIICRKHNSYDCGAYGTVKIETIAPLNHPAKVYFEEQSATCSSTGIKAHFTCMLCKQDFIGDRAVAHSEIIIPRSDNHTNIVTIPGTPANCKTNTNGLSDGKYCTDCGRVVAAQNVIVAKHTPVTVAGVDAKCDVEGKTNGEKCSVCDTILISQKTIPATGHQFGEWVETKAATTTSKGELKRTCLNEGCDAYETQEIPELIPEHICSAKAELAVVTKAPTCTEKGLKQNYCDCGKKVGDPIEIAPTGHTVLVKVDAVEATCVKKGVEEYYKCGICGDLYRDANATKKIKKPVETSKNKDNHNADAITITAGVAPTCAVKGYTESKKCTDCKTVLVKDRTLDRVPCDQSKMEIVLKAATCTEPGVKEHKHCPICNKDYDMNGVERKLAYFNIPALGHDYDYENATIDREATEDNDGQKTATCKRDGCNATITIVIPKTNNHKHTIKYEIESEADCTHDGKKVTKYSCHPEIPVEADDYEEIIIKAKGHNLKLNKQVGATCYSEGVEEHYECSVCHALFLDLAGTKPVTENSPELVLAKTVHEFVGNGNTKNCKYGCGEKITIEKNHEKVQKVETSGEVKKVNSEDDTKKLDEKKEIMKAIGTPIEVEVKVNLEKLDEISTNIDKKIENDLKTQGVDNVTVEEDKVVFDVVIEKIVKHKDGNDQVIDEEKEVISETEDYITITIDIPGNLQGKEIAVYRVHGDVTERIKDAEGNVDAYISTGTEYYVKEGNQIKLNVKKFSEYAVVGFDEEVFDDSNDVPVISNGGGGSATVFTVTFNANGGVAVDSVKVKPGAKVAEPTTTREGYIFKGWYANAAFTQLFDFDAPINRSITLYAKWEEDTGAGSGWFIDVPETEWFYEAIKYAFDNGLMNGISDVKFAPNDSITRAMFVTVLYRIENEPEFTGSLFTDVETDTWYTDAVIWATANGITNGVSETEFAPDQIILREQIAAMLFRYAKFKGYDVSVGEETNILSYTDAEKISEYAIPAFQWAVGSGVLKGKSETTLNPLENATRAEAAALLMRIIEKYNK